MSVRSLCRINLGNLPESGDVTEARSAQIRYNEFIHVVGYLAWNQLYLFVLLSSYSSKAVGWCCELSALYYEERGEQDESKKKLCILHKSEMKQTICWQYISQINMTLRLTESCAQRQSLI